MPTNRTRRSRLWQAELDDYRRLQLLEGPDAVLLAGVGYLHSLAVGPFDRAPAADQATVLAEMEADWRVHGPALLAWWNEGDAAPRFSGKPWLFPLAGGPGCLPWAAEQFGAPRDGT